MANTCNYAIPRFLTDLRAEDSSLFVGLPSEPLAISALARHLVIQQWDAARAGVNPNRFVERDLRPASSIVRQLALLNAAPLHVTRDATQRVVGTCRHFSIVTCALLRLQGIESRARCGFSTYFYEGKGVDHWIVEYRTAPAARWIRLDSEIVGLGVLDHPEDLDEGLFVTGGEAWLAARAGSIDPSQFGVYGTENWGPAEIQGNLVRDVAALNKVEMLPWDEWGKMSAAYEGSLGSDYDAFLEVVARACERDDESELAELFEHPDLRVPASLISEN